MLIDLVTPFGKRGGGDGSTIKRTEYRDLAMNDRSLAGSVRLVRVIATPDPSADSDRQQRFDSARRVPTW